MTRPMSIERLNAAAALRGTGLEPRDARLLLQHVLGVSHTHLITHGERVLTEAEAGHYVHLVGRRRLGEPIAYLIGWREFYGRRFAVDQSVLIPRPESELLVDLALERIRAENPMSVVDLATGSGNIAVSLALERPAIRMSATDLSAAALDCACANAARLGADRIEFLQSDWLAALGGRRFDLIVSNPPYIAEDDAHLQQGDLRFEPRSALVAGADGLAPIRTIVSEARRHLNPGGWLLFEHGYDQATACAQLLAQAGFSDLVHAKDLAGLPRVAGGRAL